MVVLVAIASTCCFAVASAFQQYAASRVPPELSLRPGLIVGVARQRMWWIGVLGDIGGFAFQWLAISLGAIALVQPIMLGDLVFALPLGAWLVNRRPRLGELAAAAAVVAGLTMALMAASPHTHGAHLGGTRAIMVGAACAGSIVVLIIGARGRDRSVRAALLGTAAGIAGATLALFTRVTTVALRDGVFALLVSWKPYALAVAALVSLLLVQSAFQAGPLRASLPTLNLADPLLSVVLGLVVLGERVRFGWGWGALELSGMVVAVVGALVLIRFDTVVATFGNDSTDEGSTGEGPSDTGSPPAEPGADRPPVDAVDPV